MTIKAINTRYDGHHFRSRLEARWAVFFNHLGWTWEYEPEGYQLTYQGKEVFYLPDFLLTFPQTASGLDHKVFVEVKGPKISKADLFKIEALAYNSGNDVYLLAGIPKSTAVGDYWDICTKNTHIDEDQPGDVLWLDVDIAYRQWRDYADAMAAARKARFEHGECG